MASSTLTNLGSNLTDGYNLQQQGQAGRSRRHVPRRLRPVTCFLGDTLDPT
jgi:hypothetical protein